MVKEGDSGKGGRQWKRTETVVKDGDSGKGFLTLSFIVYCFYVKKSKIFSMDVT